MPAFGCNLKNTKETEGIRDTASKKSELTKKEEKNRGKDGLDVVRQKMSCSSKNN